MAVVNHRRSHLTTNTKYQPCYAVDIDKPAQVDTLQRLAETNGVAQVRRWADEGIPIDAMGTPSEMQAYRQRKDTPVPWDAERQNEQSRRRSELVQRVEAGKPAGDTQVPDSVRNVISSPGQSLDTAVQREMEDRMGDSFGDVQVHTGPKAAEACDDINAKAFTVGNNIAFNSGEYDPSSAEGQHVLAHELTHVRQQTDGAVSMLPQDDVALEIDPDPKLEKEAEETAQRVMAGGKLDIQRMTNTDVHVQRAGLGSMDTSKTGFHNVSGNSGGASPSSTDQPETAQGGGGEELGFEEFGGGDLNETVGTLVENQQRIMDAFEAQAVAIDNIAEADESRSLTERAKDSLGNLTGSEGKRNLAEGVVAGGLTAGAAAATAASGGLAAAPIAAAAAAPALRGAAADFSAEDESIPLNDAQIGKIAEEVERIQSAQDTGTGDSQGVGESQR